MNELQLLKNQAETQMKLISEFEVLKNKQDNTDKRVEVLEKTMTLNRGEAFKIKHKVREKAVELTKVYFGRYVSKELFGKKRVHIGQAIYSILNKTFNAVTYTTILHVDYEEAVNLIKLIDINNLPTQYLQLTEHQHKVSLKNGDNLPEDFIGAHMNRLPVEQFEFYYPGG